ncbi:MAG: hypothetical protein K0S47_3087 [Herbinix sp.]|nr:hypothetical protein [Herbinix sp.]
MMLQEALDNYNFVHPEAVFIRHNENITYAVTDDNKKYLLRIHKAADGLDFSLHCGDTPREVFIDGEIELLIKLHDLRGFKLQYPIKNIYDQYITRLHNGDLVTVLSWLDGDDLVNATITEELVYQIGQMIGELHNTTSQILNVNRFHYDESFVNRLIKELRSACDMKHISELHLNQIEDVLLYTKDIIKAEKKNYVLIHADFSKSNLIYDKVTISPIDFSLSGYGVPEMDLSDLICSLHHDELIPSLIAGYESVGHRTVNKSYISAFMVLSIISYIAIHHNKVYQDEKFVKAMDRWCNTMFTQEFIQLER